MTRTQVQLPDALYRRARELAARREISLAELVRRGLEYMISVSPAAADRAAEWELPEPVGLGGADPFTDPGWRERLHVDTARAVAESPGKYRSRKGAK
jgi:hypothetical protein